MKCPFCAEKIQPEAKKCKHCGEWLPLHQDTPEKSISTVEELPSDANAPSFPPLNPPMVAQQKSAPIYSNAQPLWHLVLFSIVTLNFYCLYWFYRNWKHLKAHKGLDISPGWRLIGLFVPFYCIYLIYDGLGQIQLAAREAGVPSFPRGFILFSLMLSVGFGNAAMKLGLLWLLIPVIIWGSLVLLPAQQTLNQYWQREQPNLQMRKGFTSAGIVALLVGMLFSGLIIWGTFSSSPMPSVDSNQESSIPASQNVKEWITFPFDSGRAAVSIPDKPIRQDASEVTPVGKITIITYLWTHESGRFGYGFGYTQYPEVAIEGRSEDEILRSCVKGSLERVNGTPITERNFNYDDYPAREVVLLMKQDSTEIQMTERFYLIGKHLYIISVVKEKGYTCPDAERFLDSFRLIEDQ